MENFLCDLAGVFPGLGDALGLEDCPVRTPTASLITVIITLIAGIGLLFR